MRWGDNTDKQKQALEYVSKGIKIDGHFEAFKHNT